MSPKLAALLSGDVGWSLDPSNEEVQASLDTLAVELFSTTTTPTGASALIGPGGGRTQGTERNHARGSRTNRLERLLLLILVTHIVDEPCAVLRPAATPHGLIRTQLVIIRDLFARLDASLGCNPDAIPCEVAVMPDIGPRIRSTAVIDEFGVVPWHVSVNVVRLVELKDVC